MVPESEKKSIPKSIEIWMPLGIGILSDLLKFLVPKWGQVGTKIDLKSMLSSKDDFLKKHRFLKKNNDLDDSGGPSWGSKPIKIQ